MAVSSKVKYDQPAFNPPAYSRHHIDRQAVEQVPEQSFVLDVGCATGFMGAYLHKKKRCTVFGLDVRISEAAIAKKVLHEMVIGSIEDEEIVGVLLNKTKGKKFDVILATSLIEHLHHPSNAVKIMKKVLRPKGLLILTTPNIAHWTTRLMLFRGEFTYTEYGIMDNTHTHFFTAKTLRELAFQHSFKEKYFSIDAEGGGYPRLSIFLSHLFPNLFGYQMLYVGQKM